jgi:hypothetical protein
MFWQLLACDRFYSNENDSRLQEVISMNLHGAIVLLAGLDVELVQRVR